MSKVIVVGGGLAGCLVAYRCAQAGHSVALYERGSTLGGNKTWSFHGTDVDDRCAKWLRPFVVSAWPTQAVRFPAFTRRLTTPYYTVTSSRLDQVLRSTPGITIFTDCEVTAASETAITLATGEQCPGDQVWDSRPLPSSDLPQGYQKFLGLELRLESDHGLAEPIIMDATLEQRDGFRFMYVLPFSPRCLLLEDTYYSANPALDDSRLRAEIQRYAEERGWKIASVVREEKGVLPIPLSRRAFACSRTNAFGFGAGLFQPTTGYSLPLAVQTAEWIAARNEPSSTLSDQWVAWRESLQKDNGLYCLLNRLLFRALPRERFRVLQRFYRLPQGLIERFYGRRMTRLDWMRVLLWGKPPMSVSRAASAVLFAEGIDEPSR